MKWKGTFRAAAFAAFAGGSLNAAALNGTFDIVGQITATSSTIDWSSGTAGNVSEQATITNATGDFAGLNGTTITIMDLDSTTEPTGTTFGPDTFITFDANPALDPLLINFIFPGLFSNAQCTVTPPAPGQECTPNGLASTGLSPFSFVNNPPPGPVTSSASFVFSGTEGSSFWDGIFTSQFSTPYQTVLGNFGSSGSVTNSYSATFTVTS